MESQEAYEIPEAGLLDGYESDLGTWNETCIP